MTAIFQKAFCATALATTLAVPGVTAQTVQKAGIAARMLPCHAVKDLAHQSAIAAAQTWHGTRWASIKPATPKFRGWMTAYVLPQPPPAPLGISSFARAQELGADTNTSKAPVAGYAHIAKLLCVTGVPAADGTLIVQFVGLKLHFKEGDGVWSKPLRRPALLHALILSRATPDTAWSIAEEPDAPTVLIPGSQLSPPASAEIRSALLPSARAAVAKQSR